MNPSTNDKDVHPQFMPLTSGHLANVLSDIILAPVLPDGFDQVLAHEIRNPLSSIKLAAQMLKSMGDENMKTVYIDIILRSTDRINTIVTKLLTPPKAGEITPEICFLHDLLEEVLEIAGERILLKNVTVIKEYRAKNCKTSLNVGKIKMALTNIIINAIDAMKPGEGQLKIVTKPFGNNFILQIEDNGCGISKENLKNMFKPYFTDKPGGLGLGLTTTYNALQADHVSLHVKSEVGTGTCFTLLFSCNP